MTGGRAFDRPVLTPRPPRLYGTRVQTERDVRMEWVWLYLAGGCCTALVVRYHPSRPFRDVSPDIRRVALLAVVAVWPAVAVGNLVTWARR